VGAYVTIVFDNCFLIRQIKVIKGKAGPFVGMPSRKLSDGTRVNIAYPASSEMQSTIEKTVLAEYERVIGQRAKQKRTATPQR
jgi:stage V sporulation protein G